MARDRDDDAFGLRPPGESTEPLEVIQARSGGPSYDQQQQPYTMPLDYGYAPQQPPHAQLPAQRSKKRHPVRTTFITLLVILLVVGGIGGGYAWWLIHKFDSQSQTIDQALPDYAGRPADGPGQNILLLGSDTRSESKNSSDAAKASGRTDSMMFVHVPKGGGAVTVTSIMRDTWVPIPGHGKAKINAAFAYGGVPLAVRTVEELLDTRIDHVATIDFSGFKGVVDALGGVTVDVPVPFTKSGTHFEGRMKLTGDQALTFARERHSFKNGDYQRVKDQQILVRAILGKVASPSTVLNPPKMSKTVDNLSPFMGVDEDLSGWGLAKLGWGLRSVAGHGTKMFTLPNLGTGWAGRQSIVKPDMEAIRDFSQALKDNDVEGFMSRHKLG